MEKKYIALIRKENDTDYWVDIPDLPGCISSGETEDEAMANFEEAFAFHLEGMREDGLPLPNPRSKDEVLAAETESYIKAYLIEAA